MTWYIPSIQVRKQESGTRCPGCSLYMHHKDMVAFSTPDQTIYIHDQCAALLLESKDVIPEDSDAAAEESD